MYIPVKCKENNHESYLFYSLQFQQKKYIAKGQDKNNNRAEKK